MLGRSPGFTAVVLLVIGLGIGANTALFNALDQVYARPLPVKEPHELVSVQYHYRHGSFETTEGSFSYPDYEAYRDRAEVFTSLVAFGEVSLNLRVGDAMTRVQGSVVSVNYFSELGIRPALGRLFAPPQEWADDAVHPVAVISHGLWHRQFGGDARVIGKQMILNEQPLTIIGVAPRGFTGTVLGHTADVYLPLGTSAQMHQEEVHSVGGLCLLGRLKAGVGREQAQAALRVLAAQMRKPEPDGPRVTMLVVGGSQGYVPEQARVAFYPLALFLGMAVLVLVIACANIANLLLSRAATRHKEIAVRQALGAGRRRVLRQLLVESVLLALAGGVCGVVLAVCLDRVICTALTRIASVYIEPELQVRIHPGLHPRVLLFALAISLAAGIAFGLAPALQTVRRNIVSTLKESAGYGGQPARRWNPHSLLVVGQIVVALVVMVCSGLCLRSLIGLHRINPGYDTTHLLVVSLPIEVWPTHDRPELRRFFEDLQERVNGLPEVVSTSLADCAPVSEASSASTVIDIEGLEMRPGRELSWRLGVVSPGHFQTLGQALLAGRDFTVRDGVNAPKVMVVNEVLARRYWPNQDPLGKRVTFYGGGDKAGEVREVVGVVKAVKLRSILEESVPVAYLSLAQQPKVTPVLLVRTAGKPQPLIPMIRKEAAAIGAPAALDIRTVAERVSGLLFTQQVLTGILNVFGLVGLLLSATGIYAVMAYAVRQRTREIGIRMALGVRGRDVLVPVLLRGALLMTVGWTLGLGVSLAGTRVLAGLLPQIRAWDKFFLQGIYTWDPLTYVCTTLVILTVVLLACYVPARRAARIDPMVALRCE
jgi:putative ABC transport system permease protein